MTAGVVDDDDDDDDADGLRRDAGRARERSDLREAIADVCCVKYEPSISDHRRR